MTVFMILPLQATGPDDLNNLFIRAAARAKSSVVHIVIYNRHLRRGREMFRKVANASGTIITRSGYVVTNYHVVSKGNFYRITTSNGREYDAASMGKGKMFLADVKTDIALLKIDGRKGERFSSITFSGGEPLQEGEWVIAIGNPYGLSQSITGGIVSSTGRNNIGFADIEDFIQSDVSINPGNSGGPLINLKGEMVGLNTAIRSVSGGFQGISFSIPAKIVKHVCYELNRHGRVRRGWLGFIARENHSGGRNFTREVEIISIVKKSPAERAGLCRGDIVRFVDGRKIKSLSTLITYVGKKPVGSPLKIVISRDGKLHPYNLTLREKRHFNRLREVLQILFTRYGLEVNDAVSSRGITVSYVSPRNMHADVRKGDIIVGMNGMQVRSLDDFVKKLYRCNTRLKSLEIYRDTRFHEIFFSRSRYRD